MVVPPNAAYISRDGLVTFDENGRKLDSLGNVAWADTQTLKGADARPLERPAAPPPPPQAQRAAAAVAPPLTPQRFFPEVAPPSTALGMPQSGPVRPGMTDYPRQLSAPSSFGPAQAGQGGGGGNSWESQVYMPGYQGPKPTTPFAANPNSGPAMSGGQTMGGATPPSMYTGPSTTDTTSWSGAAGAAPVQPFRPMAPPTSGQGYDAAGQRTYMPVAMAPGSPQFQQPPMQPRPSYEIPTDDYIMPPANDGRTYPIPPKKPSDYQDYSYYQPPWVPGQEQYPADTYTPSTPGFGWGPKW